MTDAFHRMLDEANRVPLHAILVDFGLAPHRDDGILRYQNARCFPGRSYDIAVPGRELWFDSQGWASGRGAVDLVTHLHFGVPSSHACRDDHRKAVEWLRNFTAKRGAIPTQVSERDALLLVHRDDRSWPLARHHLVGTNKIPAEIVNHLHEKGDVYAAHLGDYVGEIDLCYVRRDTRLNPSGLALQSLAHSTTPLRLIGARDAWFSVGNLGGTKVVLAHGPIEAISYLALTQADDTLVYGMPRLEVPADIMERAHALEQQLVVAFPLTSAAQDASAICRSAWQNRYGDQRLPCRITPNGPSWGHDLAAMASLRRGRSR